MIRQTKHNAFGPVILLCFNPGGVLNLAGSLQKAAKKKLNKKKVWQIAMQVLRVTLK